MLARASTTVTGDVERLLERRAQLPGDGRGALDAGLARGQDAERVALQAGHGVGVANGSAQALGDRVQAARRRRRRP